MLQLPLWTEPEENPIPAHRNLKIAQIQALARPHKGAIIGSLDELKSSADEYVEQAHAEHTRRAYRSDWSLFERWCAQAGRAPLPASSETLRLYLTHLAKSGRKASTIRRARIAVGLAHGYAGWPRPDRNPLVRALERGIGRVHGAREEGADPLLKEDVLRIVRTFSSSPRGDRDRAIILLGFAGAFRASELVGLNVDDVKFTGDGVEVFLGRSKEDPLKRGVTVRIGRGDGSNTCPVDALRRWIERVGRPCGPLFRMVRGSTVHFSRLHPRAVSRVVQQATARAGLMGEYSAHSLRSGLATSAYAHGARERDIQDHGRWKDRRSLDRYIRVASLPNRRNVTEGLL